MKIALIGYGKMGHAIEQVALKRGHTIVCRIDIDNLQDFDSPEFKSADIAIEFTAPTQAFSNIQKAFKAGIKVVSGSTGWMAEHAKEVEAMCSNGANTLFWSSNYSLGVAIFSMVNGYLAKIMNSYPEYGVEMSETHHIHKLDAPSGTAITLAESIIANIDRVDGWTKGTLLAADGTVSGSEKCADNLIRIDSIREGENAGVHTISYDSPADTITITHSAKDRSGLALGAVIAAEYTINHTGLLKMQDLMASL